MSKHLPHLTAGEHEILALALRIPEDEVILPASNEPSRKDIDNMHEAGWLDFRDPDGFVWDARGNLRAELSPDPDEIVVGYIASAELRAQPWAGVLIDNPFPD